MPYLLKTTSAKKDSLVCESSDCPFRRQCANHRTAGDFRSEDGFSPNIVIKFNEFYKDIVCVTRDANPIWYDEFSERTYPVNVDKLGTGCVYLSDGRLKILS